MMAGPPGLAASTAVLPVVFVDGDQSVDLGTVTVQPSLGIKKLHAVVADRVGLAPNQISASLARPNRRARRVPLDDATDLAAAVAREGSGCYVQAVLRRSSRRGGRSHRRDRKQPTPQPEKTILKRLPPVPPSSTDLPVLFGACWDYEAQLRELQRQREWYLMNTTAAPDPSYFALAPPPDMEVDPAAMWSPRCHECEAAAAAMRHPAFHFCVRDAVTVGFRSPVGPIERPTKKAPAFLGMTMSVY